MNEAVRPVASACGRAEGECCYPLHQAAQAFAGEREAALLVPEVVGFVGEHPGCSAKAVYDALMPRGWRRASVLSALELAVARDMLRRDWIGPRRQRFWLAR